MATLNIFCAGAAQAVMMQIAAKYKSDSGNDVVTNFGAVGAMKARVVAGEPADVIVLTAALIDELIAQGLAVAGSRVDLGKVGTGVAVRAGTPLPDVGDTRVLRGNLLAAKRVLFPDPAVATAGKVVMSALDKMGITDELKGRLHFFPNGYAAMNNLAQSKGLHEMGITQITEIVANKGVTLVGPLPAEVQNIAVYSAGLAADSANAQLGQEFIRRLTGFAAQPVLSAAGFDVGS
ncbi:MAG: bacterial extracellular solute-binding family protein [Betaproteobacteria bacterium]|nr:bacterial extracellular solute-binding family protein [Betaproteobacteria bacterium]